MAPRFGGEWPANPFSTEDQRRNLSLLMVLELRYANSSGASRPPARQQSAAHASSRESH